MKNKISSIVGLFGEATESKCREDFLLLVGEVCFTLAKMPSVEDLHAALPRISERDSWRLRLLSDDGDDLFDLRKGVDIDANYEKGKLKPYIGDNVKLVYSVDKNKESGVLTIYNHGAFLEYIRELYANDFISILKNNLDNKLIFEFYGEEVERFSTSSVSFIRHGDPLPLLSRDEQKARRTDDCREQCQWNNKLAAVLPEDVRIIRREEPGELAKLFDQMSLLLSAVYVADFSSVDKSGITLRMSGFKMMVTECQSSQLKALAFDEDAVEQWYRIYDWSYTGGYIIDRLSIARNLITLNCPDSEKLSLNASTFDAIKSNFKIFEKDNVRQYIKVRNEVSKTLLDLQDRINSTVESFTSDFRKSVVGLGTFFLTLVVVRVVANGEWTGAFSGQIVGLSFIFVALSAVILFFSRVAINRKEKLFNKHYGQLRKRYEALLSKEELDELFEDGNPNRVGSHSNYIQDLKKVYTWIWAIFLVAISVFLVLVWCYNLFESTNIVRIIKAIMACCTKSI